MTEPYDPSSALTFLFGAEHDPTVISFAGGLPDTSVVQRRLIVELFTELADEGDELAFQYAPVQGLPSFLEAVCNRLEVTQGRRPRGEELLITSGAMDGLHLFVGSRHRRSRIAVESPSYVGALMAMRAANLALVGVDMDDEGLDVDKLLWTLGRERVDCVYVIPDHQNPSSRSMSLPRRRELIAAAIAHDVLIVEDVAYRDLTFDGRNLPTLWSMAPDHVVQLGTFSKSFFAGVRLGWAVGPSTVIADMVTAKQTTDQCAGALGQRLLERLLLRGNTFENHLENVRSRYAMRSGALSDALSGAGLEELVDWKSPAGGFFLWLRLPDNVDVDNLAMTAFGEYGVAVMPGRSFFVNASTAVPHLRLSYSRVALDQMESGVERLSRALTAECAAVA